MRITKLDGLRGIFSLMVVLYHYEAGLPQWLYSSFIIRESGAFVDFFFVLSGFVISYNYHSMNTKKEFWIYLKKRFVRLYPLLIYSVLICLMSFLVAGLFPLYLDVKHSTSELLYKTIDSLTFLNSTILFGDSTGMNFPSWSISAEMISYIIFGFCTILFTRKKNILLFIIILLLLIFFFYNHGALLVYGDYGFLRGLFAFLLGYFVWELSLLKFRINNNLEYCIPFIILSAFYFLHINEFTNNRVWFEILLTLTFSLVILMFIKTSGVLTNFLENRVFQFLGKISYSVYLNHAVVLYVFPNAIFKLFNLPANDVNQVIVLLCTLLLVIIYSHITYLIIELKLGKFLKKYMR